MAFKFIFAFLYIIALNLFFIKPVYAQDEVDNMQQLQAAYLYNFAKYIQWPNEFEEFVIGIYKDEKLQDAFYHTIKERKILGKNIIFKEISIPESALQCHMIYLTSAYSGRLASINKVIKTNSILIVTEDDLIKKGAMVSFILIDEKFKFKMKHSLVTQNGLLVREGLLKLAIIL